MAFSRQHFQKFADLLKKMHGKDQEMLATELIQMFREDNPRFDAERFAKAAGLEGNTRLHNVVMNVKEGKVNESFDNLGMKLVELLPTAQIKTLTHNGRVNELAFHGGNPTPEDVQVLADDFEEEMDGVEEKFDETHHGFIEAAREADFNDVATGIGKQWNQFAKALSTYRANIENLYKEQQKKLGGGKEPDIKGKVFKTRSNLKHTIVPNKGGFSVKTEGGVLCHDEDGVIIFKTAAEAVDAITRKWR